METSERNFNQASKMAKDTMDVIARFLEAIGNQLAQKGRFAAQLALAEWIKDGNSITSIHPYAPTSGKLLYQLDLQKIPYVSQTDGSICVKPTDVAKIHEIERSLKIAHCMYFQEVGMDEMENDIALYGNEKKKEMLILKDVDPHFKETIVRKCNDISKGFMVGTEALESGNYNLAVAGTKIFTTNDEEKDFCKAYLQAVVSLYGPNHDVKVLQLIADEKLEKEIKELPDDGVSRYIVGVDDKNVKNVVEITPTDFQYYQWVADKDGQIRQKMISNVDKDDPSYELELDRCLDRINNKAMLYDVNEYEEHINTNERTVGTLRPEKSYEQYLLTVCTERMVEKIDEVIRKDIKEKRLEDAPVEEVFGFYKEASEKIMEGIRTEKFPPEYEEACKQIREEFVKDVSDSIDKLAERNADIQTTPKDIVNSFERVSSTIKETKTTSRVAERNQTKTKETTETKETKTHEQHQDNR